LGWSGNRVFNDLFNDCGAHFDTGVNQFVNQF
jgi:hypothetical protein